MENKWFEKLTEAQKTKLRGMGGNAEELIAFCKQERLELPDELLEAVSGEHLFPDILQCNERIA